MTTLFFNQTPKIGLTTQVYNCSRIGAILNRGRLQVVDTSGQLSKLSKLVACNTSLSQFRLELQVRFKKYSETRLGQHSKPLICKVLTTIRKCPQHADVRGLVIPQCFYHLYECCDIYKLWSRLSPKNHSHVFSPSPGAPMRTP